MRRREFITLLGGAAAAWPFAAHAQQSERVRRIGVLVSYTEGDPELKARLAGLRQGLERLGWSEGRNLHIDYRFAAGRAGRFQPLAKELIALQPEVIFVQSTAGAAALHRESGALPIVFVNVSDPVGSGFIARSYGGCGRAMIWASRQANRRTSRSLGPSAPPNLRGSSSINLREHGVKASEAAESCENCYFHHRLIGFIDEPFRALNAGRPCYRARTRL